MHLNKINRWHRNIRLRSVQSIQTLTITILLKRILLLSWLDRKGTDFIIRTDTKY